MFITTSHLVFFYGKCIFYEQLNNRAILLLTLSFLVIFIATSYFIYISSLIGKMIPCLLICYSIRKSSESVEIFVGVTLPKSFRSSGSILKSFRGDTRAEFAEHFRRKAYIRQILGNICRLHVFFIRKTAHEKFVIDKIVHSAFGPLLLPRIC